MTADKDALLPCPFCGEVPIIKQRDGLASFCCPPKSTCMQSGVFTAFDPMVTQQAIRWWNRRARITAAMEDGGWIKCSERLPDEYHPVLIGRTDIPQWIGPIIAFRQGGNFYQDVAKGTVHCTHWQPLPPLPKTERGE